MAKLEEDVEFPILCPTCYGDNPYIRMTFEKFGKACKICDRPFTVFRWKPGPKTRYKKTEICNTCAKLKNVCQTCILDLEYGLPVQLRDSALEKYESGQATSEVMKKWLNEKHEKEVEEAGGYDPYEKTNPSVEAMLRKIAQNRSSRYNQRNLPHICSFFASGHCARGDECPYRHVDPKEAYPDPSLAKQNLKDRYYGENDPVALKLMRKSQRPSQPPLPPADKTNTTIWVGGLDNRITESDLRAFFGEYGEIQNIYVSLPKSCAFVTFLRRSEAEETMKKAFQNASVRGVNLILGWSKGQSKKQAKEVLPPPPGMGVNAPLVNNPNANKNLGKEEEKEHHLNSNYVLPPPGMGPTPFYPSMQKNYLPK